MEDPAHTTLAAAPGDAGGPPRAAPSIQSSPPRGTEPDRAGRAAQRVSLLAAGLIALLSLATWLALQGFGDANRWVEHTNQVRLMLDRALQLTVDAEAGNRGFLLTGQHEYLEPYEASTREIAPTLKALRDLTADNPAQQRAVDELGPLIAEKLSLIERSHRLYIEGQKEGAIALLREGSGRRAMGTIRQIIQGMQEREEALLQQRIARARSTQRFLVVGAVLLDAALASLFVWLFLVRRDARRRGELAAQKSELLEQRLKAEQQLNATETLLNTVVQEMPFGIVVAETGSGQVTFANRRMEAITAVGFAPDEGGAGGRSPRGADDGGAPYRRALELAGTENRVVRAEPVCVQRADGDVAYLEITAAPVRDPSGAPFAVVGIVEDVSERQNIERARERAAVRTRLLAEAGGLWASAVDDEVALRQVAELSLAGFCDWSLVVLLGTDGAPRLYEVACADPSWRDHAARLRRFPILSNAADQPVDSAIRGRTAVLYPECTDDKLLCAAFNEEHLALLRGLKLCSCIVAPLVARDHAMGALLFMTSIISGRKLELDDLHVAEELTRRAALAIENMRLFAENERERASVEAASRRLAQLQQVTAALSSAATLADAAHTLAREAAPLLDAQSATVCLIAGRPSQPAEMSCYGYPEWAAEPYRAVGKDIDSPMWQAIREMRPVAIESCDELLTRYPYFPTELVFGEAWLSVPMGADTAPIGALNFSFARARQFTAQEMRMLSTLAELSAQAISRARLLEIATEERRRAEEASRAKDEFLAVVSHELRTPLTAILGWARMLRTGSMPEDRREKALETIERNARSQTQLIEDLLDITRIITGKLRLNVGPVNLNHAVEAAVETVKPAADAKGVRLQVVLDSHAPLMGDPDRLQQIAWNLLSNAVKFTSKGGRVQVRVVKNASYVELIVEDTGQGIQPEFLPQMFERFRQQDGGTTRTQGGLGLGLTIVRHLVELHGGTVSALSEGAGRGATFIVRIPIAPLRDNCLPPPDGPMPPTSPLPDRFRCPQEIEGLSVLVLDDEPDARELLVAVLQHCSAKVRAAATPDEAMVLLQELRPDVLISDIGMPGEDGYSFINRVRSLADERGGRTPAVALTAYARAEDRTRALMAGFNMHVPKPIEPSELLAVLATVSGRRTRR